MRKLLFLLALIALPSIAEAQTPSTLRVNVDATGALVAIGGSQTLPLTSCLFSNCRLKVDASGNLVVVLAGGTVTSPFFAPTQASCATVSYSFTGRTTTGLNSHAADTWNLCGGGTLGLSGNTTTLTANLNFLFSSDGSFNIGDSGGTGRPNNIYAKSIVTVNSGAGLTTAGVDVGANNDIYWASKAKIRSPSNGIIGIYDDAATSFNRLQFGGTTSSFPAIKRSSATIHIRLADDSGFADLLWRNAEAQQDGYIGWTGRSIATSPSDGIIRLTNNATTDFSRLQFGGTTSSFPAIKRNAAAINFRLADDSADANITAGFVNLSGTLTTASSDVGIFFGSRGTVGMITDGIFKIQNNAASRSTVINSIATPTCSSNCGTSPSVTGTNSSFTVTMGATGVPASGFVITFGTTNFSAAPQCIFQMAKAGMANTKTPLTVVTTTSTATVVTNGAAPANGDMYHGICTLGT